MFEKSFPQSARPTLREISPEFGCRSPCCAPEFERNALQNEGYIRRAQGTGEFPYALCPPICLLRSIVVVPS